ncbi:transcriptional regulator [Arthrobacter sp. PGP41]|uniref:helix-turn-helix domain-containing protein n=1 Tax=Arthrobacter sp. PGP41 TaxID=2079227 RepID=UPI000CDC6704|nr:helix-turn-helix domain-containing protein [Arthrobacter sp. PGP41]AUZ36114.1 transcriptional regulator [Arthrobacter sp. PGP41]
MAVEAHQPRAGARHGFPVKGAAAHGAAARGLALWVVPAEGTSPDLLARAAQLVLARALQTAPEAEVHWPAAGAPTSGSSADTGGAAGDSPPAPPAAEAANPALSKDDGGTRLPPSAGPVSRVAVDLAADIVLLDGSPVPLTGVESKVLRYLVTHLSRPVDREELQEFLESLQFPGASARAIDVYVGRIRGKLGNARHAVATVRGGGYQFVPGPCATVRGPAEYCI